MHGLIVHVIIIKYQVTKINQRHLIDDAIEGNISQQISDLLIKLNYSSFSPIALMMSIFLWYMRS